MLPVLHQYMSIVSGQWDIQSHKQCIWCKLCFTLPSNVTAVAFWSKVNTRGAVLVRQLLRLRSVTYRLSRILQAICGITVTIFKRPPDNADSKYLWNIGKLLPDYMAKKNRSHPHRTCRNNLKSCPVIFPICANTVIMRVSVFIAVCW
jgi:hypothetical protein